MSFNKHVAYGGLAAIVFYFLWGPAAVFFWAGSVLIDLDHYVDYVYHSGFRDFSVKRMFDYHKLITDGMYRRPEFLNLSIFHTVEFLCALYILGHITDSFAIKAVFFGCIFHMALDLIWLYQKLSLFTRSFFVIEYFIRRRLLMGRGLNPATVYREASRIVRGQDIN